MVQKLEMGYCPLSMRLGAGAQAWAAVGAGGRAGRWALGSGGRAGRWAQARVAGARTGAQGVLALGVGAGSRAAGGRGAQAAEACRRWGAQARGRASGHAAGRAGTRQGERARGWASGHATGRTVRAGHGWQAARARSLCAQAGPVGCSCTRLGFQPGFSTQYFS